jgi:hypothetical protein
MCAGCQAPGCCSQRGGIFRSGAATAVRSASRIGRRRRGVALSCRPSRRSHGHRSEESPMRRYGGGSRLRPSPRVVCGARSSLRFCAVRAAAAVVRVTRRSAVNRDGTRCPMLSHPRVVNAVRFAADVTTAAAVRVGAEVVNALDGRNDLHDFAHAAASICPMR